MSDHIPGPGKMVSARDEAVERALMAAWCNPPESKTDAAAFLSALAAAGYAVVPVEPTREMVNACKGSISRYTKAERKAGRMDQDEHASFEMTPLIYYRAMLAAAKEPQA